MEVRGFELWVTGAVPLTSFDGLRYRIYDEIRKMRIALEIAECYSNQNAS